MSDGWTYTLVWQGDELELGPGESVAGRSRTCDVSISDPSVSRRHVILVPLAGCVRVKDLGSSNGSFVDGERIEGEAILEPGAVLRLGDAEMRLQAKSTSGADDLSATVRIDRPEPGDATSMLARESIQLADATGAAAAPPPASPVAPPAESPPSLPPVVPGAPAPPNAHEAHLALDPEAPAERIEPLQPLTPAPGSIVSGDLPSSPQAFQPVPHPESAPDAAASPPVDELSFAGLMDSSTSIPAPPAEAVSAPSPSPSTSEEAPAEIEHPHSFEDPSFEDPSFEDPSFEDSSFEDPSSEETAQHAASPVPAASHAPAASSAPAQPTEAPSFDQPTAPAAPPPPSDALGEDYGALRQPSSAGELLPSLDDIDSAIGGPDLAPPAAPSVSGFYPAEVAAPPAGFFARLVAAILDAVWIAGVSFAVQIALGDPLLGALASLLGPLVYVVGWAIWGTTPGKRALGLYVHGPDGAAGIGFARALLRLVGYAISGAILGLGFLMILFDSQNRALHDRLATTSVRRHS